MARAHGELHHPDDRHVGTRCHGPADRVHLDDLAQDAHLHAILAARALDAEADVRVRRPAHEVGQVAERQPRRLDALDAGDDVAGSQPRTCGRRAIHHRDDQRRTGALVEHDADTYHPALEHLLLDLVLLLGEVLGVAVVVQRIDEATDGPDGEVLVGDDVVVDVAVLEQLDDLGDEGLVEHGPLIPLGSRDGDDRQAQGHDGHEHHEQSQHGRAVHVARIIGQMTPTCRRGAVIPGSGGNLR